MTRSRAFLLITLAVVGVQAAAGAAAPSAFATDTCPNAEVRSQQSATDLPDCRGYEVASPELNHAELGSEGVVSGRASADGGTVVYQSSDVPGNANSGQPFTGAVRSTRDAAGAWRTVGLSPPLSTPVTAYLGFRTLGVSADLSSTYEVSEQPLDGGPLFSGGRLSFIGHPDGTFTRVDTVPSGEFGALDGANADFSRVYFTPGQAAQFPGDPGGSPYSWSQSTGLRLIGILPDKTVAPEAVAVGGGSLPFYSEDGKFVVFQTVEGLFGTLEERLYARIDESETVEVSASQRNVNPDTRQPALSVGVTADGSKILFVSTEELTNDAYTGRDGGGARNHAGYDLYSYDTATGHLSDLTADHDPADAAAGAQVEIVRQNGIPFAPVTLAAADGSVVYFLARGDLAPGGAPGRRSLYVWHEGRIDFVAPAAGIPESISSTAPTWWASPDGKHLAFPSTESLTGYDNTDPLIGRPHVEVYEYNLGGSLICASCRTDGTRPTGDASLPVTGGLFQSPQRIVADEGRRVFFHSTDALVPQSSGALQQVYEYDDGQVSPISPPAGAYSAAFVDASTSGDDVFFASYDDIVRNPDSGDDLLFDARVGGGSVPPPGRCSSGACHVPAVSYNLPVAGSLSFSGSPGLTGPAVATASVGRVSVSKLRTITGTAGSLKVTVPGRGRLTVSGSGLLTRRSSPSTQQTVTVRLSLSPAAASSLRHRRTLKRTVRVTFTDSDGRSSSATLSVAFRARSASTRRGH